MNRTSFYSILRLFLIILSVWISAECIASAEVTVINMIPNALSGETNQDSEPNLAVNPASPHEMAGSAFTPGTGFCAANRAPIFVSTDGGTTWDLNCNIPSNASGMTSDITLRFGSAGNTLYAGILRRPGGLRLNILRTANFTGPALMNVLVDRNQVDQPYVQATTAAGDDTVYVGANDFAAGGGRTATIDQSFDANPAPPAAAAFASARIESRNTAGQDGPPIRTGVHTDGTVYAVFYRLTGALVNPLTADVVVVRDDNRGTGANPYTDLAEPGPPNGDSLAGVRVVQGRTVPFVNASQANFGQERFVASNISIAVDPTNSSTVYVAWADRVGAEALYRWYKPSPSRPKKTDHFYTTSTTEPTPGSGYVNEGIAGYLPPADSPGAVPLYRFYKSSINDHLYTTNAGEVSPGSGYILEGVQGYVFATQQPGTVPLHRFYWIPARDHFYTTAKSEGDALGNDANYEGITGYIYADLPTDYTLHVRQSLNRGVTWSNDLRRITDATNPALAINSRGKVGFLYQQLVGRTTATPRWETHFERTTDAFTTVQDMILADVPANTPAQQFIPYIGDYVHLMTVGWTFYGVFSANNMPDNANFPSGVTYQRNANFATNTLLDVNNIAPVAVSIDPFFFRVTQLEAIDFCRWNPKFCNFAPEMGINWVKLKCLLRDCRVVDFIPKNCLVKYGGCPRCEPGALCPPYYHIYLGGIKDVWEVGLIDGNKNPVPHDQFKTETGIVLSFRPTKEFFIDGEVGHYSLIFGMDKKGKLGHEYKVKTRIEYSDRPFRPNGH